MRHHSALPIVVADNAAHGWRPHAYDFSWDSEGVPEDVLPSGLDESLRQLRWAPLPAMMSAAAAGRLATLLFRARLGTLPLAGLGVAPLVAGALVADVPL